MAQPLPNRSAGLFSLLLLVFLVAAHPVVGGLLVLWGLSRARARLAPGLAPWQVPFWSAMGAHVAGAMGVLLCGTLVHAWLVRPVALKLWHALVAG